MIALDIYKQSYFERIDICIGQENKAASLDLLKIKFQMVRKPLKDQISVLK